MITFEYRFDILPGKADVYEKYVKGAGKNIWSKYRGVRPFGSTRACWEAPPPSAWSR
jgi:hypothetical protein